MAYPDDGLTVADYTTLRSGSYAAIQYLSLLPETAVQTSVITSTHSSGSYASVTLADTASADIKVGHTVIVEKQSTTFSGYIQLYITRVRKAPSGTTLYIAEEFWPIFQETTYRVRIIDDFRIQPKLARESGGTYYKDYDTTFHVMRPIITGLQSAYAGFISGSNLTLSFDAVGVPVEKGAAISTYLWDVDDGTITVGSTSTASITATFPAGFRWVSLTVTDDNSQTVTRRIPVWAHNTTTEAPVIAIEGVQITRDMESGDSARLTVLGDRTDYTEARLCVLWRREWYGGTESNIVSNIDFIGRVGQSEIGFGGNPEHGVLVDDTPVLLEGISQQLGRVVAPIITTTNVSTTATAWDDIEDNTLYRALVHILNEHSTFLELHDFSISRIYDQFSTIADFKMQFWATEQGSMLNAVNSIGYSISNAALEIAPTGEAKLTPHRGIYDVFQYKNLDFTETDVIDVTMDIDWSPKKAKAEGSAGSYNSGVTDVAIASVPESAPSSGGDIITLDKQVFNSNTTLSSQLQLRLNNLLEFENLQTGAQIILPDGYHFIQPSRQHTTNFELSSSLTGFSYNALKMICNQMSIAHDNLTGARDVQSQWRAVNLNAGPVDISQISDTYFTYRTVVTWTSSTVWMTTNFFDADVVWTDVTPTLDADETIRHCLFSRDGSSSTIRLHILTYMSDTTEGRVWLIDDAQNMNSTPSAGATTSGNFRKMIPALPVTGTTPFGIVDITGANVSVKSSTNWGGSYFATNTSVGSPSGNGSHGRATNVLVAAGSNIEIATTHGGTFSTYLSTTGTVDMIHIPEDELTGTDVANISTTPDLFYALNSSGALKRVTANGATTTDITPNDGTNSGVITGEFALSTPKNNYFAQLVAVIGTFGGTPKLAIDWGSHGSSWDHFITLTSGTIPYTKSVYRGSGPPWLVYYNDDDTPTYLEIKATTGEIIGTYARPIPGNSTTLLGIEVLES